MGSKRDAVRRRAERKDTAEDQWSIGRARDWIFTRGYRVKSRMIERMLEAKSLLPIRVRIAPL